MEQRRRDETRNERRCLLVVATHEHDTGGINKSNALLLLMRPNVCARVPVTRSCAVKIGSRRRHNGRPIGRQPLLAVHGGGRTAAFCRPLLFATVLLVSATGITGTGRSLSRELVAL